MVEIRVRTCSYRRVGVLSIPSMERTLEVAVCTNWASRRCLHRVMVVVTMNPLMKYTSVLCFCFFTCCLVRITATHFLDHVFECFPHQPFSIGRAHIRYTCVRVRNQYCRNDQLNHPAPTTRNTHAPPESSLRHVCLWPPPH